MIQVMPRPPDAGHAPVESETARMGEHPAEKLIRDFLDRITSCTGDGMHVFRIDIEDPSHPHA
jgi:hypothetical protein